MATPTQVQALKTAFLAARSAGHIWPEYAACEAMEESLWGITTCFRAANNPFGRKQSIPPIYTSITLPTWEVINGHRQNIVAHFVVYPDMESAYADRMAVLKHLAQFYPEYAGALRATSGEDFVTQVSRKWSTDPNRAKNVLAIHAAHKDVFL